MPDGGAGNDTISGGAGLDAADFRAAPKAVNVDLRRRRASGWGSDRLSGVEIVVGSRHGDTLAGDAGRNHLAGMAGNDRLSGSDGSDLLDGGTGTDRLDGGPGADLCVAGEVASGCP